MSQTTKKKHVVKEVLDNYIIPQEPQQIVKVIAGRGNNLHEVETHDGDKYLVSMPVKFRKSIWIKRGDFVVVTPIEEGDKVKAEITHILMKDHIKYIRNEGKWPQGFTDESIVPIDGDSDSHDDELFENPNRIMTVHSSDSSDSESDESDDKIK